LIFSLAEDFEQLKKIVSKKWKRGRGWGTIWFGCCSGNPYNVCIFCIHLHCALF